MSYIPSLANSESNGEVHLTGRRGDAEKNAERSQTGQNLRTQRKRRDVGWRHRSCAQVGAYFGVRQDLPALVPVDGQSQHASLRSPWISADSGISSFDFLNGVLRVFLRASASPHQAYGRFDSSVDGLGSGSP
jgi:hypothetical protein